MKDTKFRILLDIHEVRSQATIPVKVGDVSCKIYITLVEGGKPYKIHENSFGVFTGKKGDDKHLFNNCVIENGIIRYDFTPQTVAAAGVLECEVRIYDEDGGVLTTPSFNIIVDERVVNDSELASSDEFSFLDEILVNEGQRIQNEKNRNEAFNNLGIDLEDDGEVISIVKTDIDGSQEKSTFLKYADVIPPVTASASGSAITIDSASAPLQNLKLFGKTEQNGTPTPDAPVPLVSVGDSGSCEIGVYGKNLLNVTKSIAFTNADMVFKNIKCPLKKGETYTLSFFSTIGGANAQFTFTGVSGTDYKSPVFQTAIERKTIYTFTPTEDVSAVRLYIDATGVATECMIEKGGFTGYQEYTKQTLTMPYELRSDKAGIYKDTVDFNKGVFVRRIQPIPFDENSINSMQRVEQPAGSGIYRFQAHPNADNPAVKKRFLDSGETLSTFLPFGTTPLGNNSKNNVITTYANGGIYFRCDSITSAEEFLQMARANNWEAQGILETPVEIPLTETELNAYRHLYTNKGNTTILSEAEAEVDYYINKPNAQAIGNIHSQINKDYFKLQQAIITTGGSTL